MKNVLLLYISLFFSISYLHPNDNHNGNNNDQTTAKEKILETIDKEKKELKNYLFDKVTQLKKNLQFTDTEKEMFIDVLKDPQKFECLLSAFFTLPFISEFNNNDQSLATDFCNLKNYIHQLSSKNVNFSNLAKFLTEDEQTKTSLAIIKTEILNTVNEHFAEVSKYMSSNKNAIVKLLMIINNLDENEPDEFKKDYNFFQEKIRHKLLFDIFVKKIS